MIIFIESINGAGKTWLCEKINKLPHVKCVDFDDIALDILSKNKKATLQRRVQLEDKAVNKLLNDYGDSHILVLIALQFDQDNKDPNIRRYFLKLSNPQVGYKRFMLREVNKIADNKKILTNIINTHGVDKITEDIDIAVRYIINFMDYKTYKRVYDDLLSSAKKNKLIIKTQEQIYDDIKQMSDNF